MQFNRLRLNGFKSFVDPTDLVINDGLTGVVGPNGCGKSNLLEAIRWVMGETRASAMRGGGMEDVIFAGAATRSTRQFAEVTLQIDNSDRRAPVEFNDSDVLEIVRRITRDAGSAYKINGKDVRARDVQILFADASTGATSPALVRQGQINELINAKPRARRRVLEEAAGISGLYQRRHEADLKLSAAEQNLLRVDDVIEQMAAQLAQLARQARQASRYREIGGELRRAEGMLLYRRWREADLAGAQAENDLQAALQTTGRAEIAARDATTTRIACEEALPALRDEDAVASAILQRLGIQRDALRAQEAQAAQKIETLRNRIQQLDLDMEREANLNRDADDMIAQLDWELSQLANATDGQDDRLSEAAEMAQDAAQILREHEVGLGRLTEETARLAARHGAAEHALADAHARLARTEAEAEQTALATEQATAALETATETAEDARTAFEEAQDAAEAAEEALAAAEDARTAILSRETTARAARATAEGEAATLSAEVAALARLVSRETAAGPQVLDHVTVASGFEAALGAALADDLAAPEVTDAATGWFVLPDYAEPRPLPDSVMPLSAHATVPAVLARRITQIGVVADRETGARLQHALAPGQRLVTTDGDLWRWDGFRAGAEDAPSAAAIRLRQINRLAELRDDLDAADARADTARDAHEALSRTLADANTADARMRELRRAAEQRLADAGRSLSRADAERAVLLGRLETARHAATRNAQDHATARQILSEAESQTVDLPDLGAARAELETAKTAVETARATMLARRAAHDELRREGDARIRRTQEVTKELSGWRHRLETAQKRTDELSERRDQATEELEDARAIPEDIREQFAELSDAIDAAQTRRNTAAEALGTAEAASRNAQLAERDAERLAGEARELRARTQTHAGAMQHAAAAAAKRIHEEADTTPQELLATLQIAPDAIDAPAKLEDDIARLKRSRETLGAVNLRAEEDARELQAEYDALVQEKSDLEEAIRKLRAGIAALNREGRERLLAAYEQVNESFRMLFTHLFGGGMANLQLIESDDPLEAGLEIVCQPPGKKLSTLSLLSGGEQTLTAMALIFAVFLATPAPICVLDEVDAPLDDANVTRFCDLLDEMTRRTDTRFLVITHHSVTMARMDRLFGVTMQEQGVSQLVSVDLKRAEQMVA